MWFWFYLQRWWKNFGLNEINQKPSLSVTVPLSSATYSHDSSPSFFLPSLSSLLSPPFSFFIPSFLFLPFLPVSHQLSTSLWPPSSSFTSFYFSPLVSLALIFLHHPLSPLVFLHFNSQKSLFDSSAFISSSLLLFSSPSSPRLFLFTAPSHLIFPVRFAHPSFSPFFFSLH